MSGANLANILTGGLVEGVGNIIDDVWTSDEERMQAELELVREDNKLALGQQATNTEEAKHASVFVAGWRPFIGWICGVALGLVYIPKAIVMAVIWAYAAGRVVWGWDGVGIFPALPAYPDLGVADLLGLIGAMLGMGSMRMAETFRGVARSEPLTKFPNPFKRKAAPVQEPQ